MILAEDNEDGGFTLIELLIVVSITIILGSIALGQYREYRLRANLASVVSFYKMMETNAHAYLIDNENYPADVNGGIVPPEFVDFVSAEQFSRKNPIGGLYDWQGPDAWGVAAISMWGGDYPPTDRAWILLDKMIDDGNIIAGKHRLLNGQYVYIIDENPIIP